MSKQKHMALLLVFYLAIAACFLFYLIRLDYSQVSAMSLEASFLAYSVIFAVIFRYWGVFTWQVILRELEGKQVPGLVPLGAVYAKAWMARYIPGTVFWIAGKIYLAQSLGISKSRLAASSLLEGGMQIVSVISVSLVLLTFDSRLDTMLQELKWFIALVSLVSLTCLLPPVFNRVLAIAYTLVKKSAPGDELRINLSAIAKSFLLYACGALISGISFYFMCRAFYPATDSQHLLYLTGAYNLAGALGMATPLLPSGIGVREGVLFALLAVIFPLEIALSLTVVGRLWSAAIDLLFFLVASAAQKFVASPVAQ
ncbi:lysylphosphatidylglycerol synthase domain-containing protein [Thiorhodovibrio frisius]|uniref:Uncharacterized protein family (UPF0104) n=1 Tax=Thiorhodovibrio frisius TaxID=631362 RepID=H8Z0I4_9GAMM|nr:lysylphosphatidylglycerol synthase domain-containing protein [Thiorhodovibrio frisius]EIC21285.1 Uncharacterized protein family (UPF0104) [Thiorhodovibrio frisius]WPL23864.1 hypothetical protein Thiofri_04071 [Thiorhodovibrio frisius]